MKKWIAGLGIAGAALIAGCSSPSTSGTGASSGTAGHRAAAGLPAAAPAARGVSGAAAAGGAASGGRGNAATARLLPAAQDVVFTSGMTIKVGNTGQAAARAAQIAESAGGYVSQENAALRSSPPGGGTVIIQLKIPVAGYASTLSVLSRLGTTSSEQQQAQVVTQQVADTASQLASGQAAIAQLRALLRQASSISELLTIQDQIASQESALEALQAQQRALDNQTSYGTVTLRLVGPVKAPPRHHRAAARHHHASGFVGGITGGWKALVAVFSWLLQVLGAVLPIGVVAALVAYLAVRSRRRWWPRRRPAPPDSPEPGTT